MYEQALNLEILMNIHRFSWQSTAWTTPADSKNGTVQSTHPS